MRKENTLLGAWRTRSKLRNYDLPDRFTATMGARPVEQREEITGVLAWCYHYLPHHFYGEPAAFHQEMVDLMEEHDRAAFAAPRGHNKSTLVTLGYVLFRTAKQLSNFPVIFSDTIEQARDLLGAIYKELLENEKLLTDYPHLTLPEVKDYRKQRVKRQQSNFITLGGVRFTARSRGSSTRGLREGNRRPDLIVLDDMENDQSVATPKQRNKTLAWFQKSVSNLFGAAGGKLFIVGTILHKQSLLAYLTSIKGPAVYVKRVYAAITNGRSLWPAAWPIWKLTAKRNEIGSRAFATEYLNQPAADESTLFKEAWIRAARVMRLPEGVRITSVVVAIDPSGTEDGAGDACGIIVAAAGSDGHAYILEDLTLNASPSRWARVAYDAWLRWQANSVVYETNYGGAMVKNVLNGVIADDETTPHYVPVTAKQGKSLRAEPVSVLYENGQVHHVGHLPELEDEMTDWLPGMASPNRLDACVYAVAHLMLGRDYRHTPAVVEGY